MVGVRLSLKVSTTFLKSKFLLFRPHENQGDIWKWTLCNSFSTYHKYLSLGMDPSCKTIPISIWSGKSILVNVWDRFSIIYVTAWPVMDVFCKSSSVSLSHLWTRVLTLSSVTLRWLRLSFWMFGMVIWVD